MQTVDTSCMYPYKKHTLEEVMTGQGFFQLFAQGGAKSDCMDYWGASMCLYVGGIWDCFRTNIIDLLLCH